MRKIHSKIFTAESSNPLSNVTWLSTKSCGSWITLRARKQHIESNRCYKPIMNFHVSLDWFMRDSGTYIHAYRPLTTCNAWFSSEALITNTHSGDICEHYALITLLQKYNALRGLPSHQEDLECHLGLVVQMGPNERRNRELVMNSCVFSRC